jgi:hypothetical protein
MPFRGDARCLTFGVMGDGKKGRIGQHALTGRPFAFAGGEGKYRKPVTNIRNKFLIYGNP